MDTAKIKRNIGQCDDPHELSEIIKAAKDRQNLLYKRQAAKAAAEAWERVKGLAPGTVLYCCASGMFIGGTIQRGTRMEVLTIQPRAKRMWVKLADEKYPYHWFKPAGVHRYDLRLEPPANPMGEDEKNRLTELGKVLPR